MAKKKLTPYQKARREYVQTRLAQRGLEGTPEERANIRQRFDVLAQTKQGRTKLAQRTLPDAPQEERKSYKRMLATELPARNMGGGGGGGGVKVPGYGDYARGLSGAQSGLPKSTTTGKTTGTTTGTTTGSTPKGTTTSTTVPKSPTSTTVPRSTSTTIPKSTTSTTVRRSTTTTMGPQLPTSKTWKDNSVVQTARKGLIAVVPGLSDVDRARTQLGRGNTLGGIGSFVSGTAQTAAFVASIVFGTPRVSGALNPGSASSGLRGAVPGPRTGGPTRPTSPARPFFNANRPTPPGSRALPPGPATSTTRAAGGTTARGSKAAPKPKSTTKKSTAKKDQTPTSKPAEKKADTPAATSNPAVKRVLVDRQPKGGTQTRGSKAAPKSKKSETKPREDMPLNTGGNYPGAKTDADFNFVKKVTEAQQVIQKQGQNWMQYKRWLDSPNTQATLKRLRGK
jgi:hypothetical protein